MKKANYCSFTLILFVLFLIFTSINNKNALTKNKSSLSSQSRSLHNDKHDIKDSKISLIKNHKVNRKSSDIDPIGIEVKNSLLAENFEITKCDDRLEFEAEYITDLTDYKLRKKAFYSINLLQLSVFENKNPSNLIHSILLSSITKMPSLLQGAKGCITVDGGNVSAEITICLGSQKKAEQLINQLSKFEKCRSGDNLVAIPPEQMEELMKACDENNDNSTRLKDPSNKESNLPIRPDNKWDEERDKFLHPSDYVVPGANSLGR